MGGAISWLQKKLMAAEEEFDFPKSLEEFGYHFNEEGKLRNIETNEQFEFEVRDSYIYNQKRYTALGDIITEHIYKIMQKEHKLQKSYLPVDAEENEPKTFAFISGDLYTNTDKLMIIIHGSGAVRAGQWSRRLIMNEDMETGSQLSYIKWARENGYALVIANTNMNTAEHLEDKKHKKPVKIRGNSSPEEHVESLWREFVQRSAAKHVAIVAHSYGGVCVLELVKNHIMEFETRVFAVALTDSVHGLRQQKAAPEVIQFYKEHGKNWASAYDGLDEPLITNQDDVPTVSAGTDQHELTSHSSKNSIFKWLIERYEKTINPSPVVPESESNPDTTEQQQQQPLINFDSEPEQQTTPPENEVASQQEASAGDDQSADGVDKDSVLVELKSEL